MGSGWNSLTVELLRLGSDPGILRRGDRYIVTRGNEKAAEYEMELDHEAALDRLDALRYASGAGDTKRREAYATLGNVVAHMLGLKVPASDLQIDLVVAAKELAALPFEAAIAPDRQPLLVRRRPAVEITRSVRGAVRDPSRPWPAKPRILLAAAQPEQAVPFADHLAALTSALSPWLAPPDAAGGAGAVPDTRGVLTVIEHASLGAIRQACADAAKKESGFTHVHLVAHGCTLRSGMREQWGLSLHADRGDGAVAVGAEDLAAALGSAGALPTVVSVTACDSGNVGSTIVSGAGLAHALHCAGVAVVLGSQFPMTKRGSTVVVERFYGDLLAGEDVRTAIHGARLALHAQRATTRHDWMSLVAYVQLPERYVESLVTVQLESALSSLRATQRWTDALAQDPSAPAERYESVAGQLRARIEALIRCARAAGESGRGAALDESRGLLGSAYKRLAELLALRAGRGDAGRRHQAASAKALRESLGWYRRAFEGNQSAHWVGVQQLSLEAVLDGAIALPWQWNAALAAAENACAADPAEYWACGSRAELHLLAPYAGRPADLRNAAAALRELAERARRQPGDKRAFALESTTRQLRRYTSWWTGPNGFFAGKPDLASDVERVLRDAGWTRSRPHARRPSKGPGRRAAAARAARSRSASPPRRTRGRT